MTDVKKGRGWHGDSEGHAQAGRKGGLAPYKGKRGFAAMPLKERVEIAQKGGRQSPKGDTQ